MTGIPFTLEYSCIAATDSHRSASMGQGRKDSPGPFLPMRRSKRQLHHGFFHALSRLIERWEERFCRTGAFGQLARWRLSLERTQTTCRRRRTHRAGISYGWRYNSTFPIWPSADDHRQRYSRFYRALAVRQANCRCPQSLAEALGLYRSRRSGAREGHVSPGGDRPPPLFPSFC